MRINFNYEGTSTHTSYLVNQREMGKALLRLSTGMRIMEAADDAAGLFIADQLSVVATGLEEGNRNIRTGISALRIAENASGQIFERLRGMYARAVRAANDINDPNARSALQGEIANLRDAIQKIGTDTEYNGIKLIDGAFRNRYIHYGPRMDQVVNVSVNDMRAQSLGAYAVTGGGSNHTNFLVEGAGARYTFDTSSTDSLITRLNATSNNFVISGTGEYVRINGNTVYEGTTTPALVDAYTLANNINSHSTLPDAGFVARAPSFTSTAQSAYNPSSVVSTSGTDVDGTINLRLYVGGASNPTANVTLATVSDGAVSGVPTTLNDLVANINNALVAANITDVRAENASGRLAFVSDSGKTVGVEVQALNIADSDTDNYIVVDFGQLFEGGTSITFDQNGTRYVGGVRTGGIMINAPTNYNFEYSGVSDNGLPNVDQGLNFNVASSTTNNALNSSTIGGNLANFITGSLNGPLSRFVLGQGEFVAINGVRVYQNNSPTPELIDSAKLAQRINENDEMKRLGVEAKAVNRSLGNTYQNTVTASVTGAANSDYEINLRFYIGDGSKSFSFQYATATQSGTDITVNNLNLDEIITKINSAASTAGANITAIKEGQRLRLETSNGETIAIEVEARRLTGSGSATFNIDLGQILQGSSNISLGVSSTNPVYGGSVKVGQVDIAGFDAFTFEYSGISDNGTANNVGFNFDLRTNDPVAFKNLFSIDVSTNAGAETAMMVLSKALQKVDTERSQIGATMNNLQSIFDAQKVAFDNTREAENVIRNVDYAEEMTNFTKLQIKMQSTIAMLAQANQMPQLVLQLLR